MLKKYLHIAFVLIVINPGVLVMLCGQTMPLPVAIDFSNQERKWDGFGVNYVETSQTFDYSSYSQDYGGFSLLNENDKEQILQYIFGEDGLKVNLVKMFLDPLHQGKEDGAYDHETTTTNMRYFVKNGIRISEKRNQELSIITTLYSPPGYMTMQNTIRGRDLNPEHDEDLVDYLVHWAAFLNNNNYPLKYISLHNEGESWLRWPEDGTAAHTVSKEGHDYNLFWTPEQVNRIMIQLRPALNNNGMHHIGITNGEPTNWYRFAYWGYADALVENKEALNNLSLVTSHGFYVGEQSKGRWFGPHSSYGIDYIRKFRPGMRSWATSSSWDEKVPFCTDDNALSKKYVMNAGFVKQIHGNIYEAKVNGFIPWAVIQRASHWNKPDPNPGSAFRVYEDGTWEIKKGYYYYKQVTRAGQPGTAVVRTNALDSEIAVIGFASNGTIHPNAFVVINFGENEKKLKVTLNNIESKIYEGFRTTGEETYELNETADGKLSGENYKALGNFELNDDHSFIYTSPPNSVTTFFEKHKYFN